MTTDQPRGGRWRWHDIGRIAVLINPRSGHGSAVRAAQLAVTRLSQRGLDVIEVTGVDAQDARRRVDSVLQQGVDALAVVGGDGVISLALQTLAGSEIPLGIVAAGTGNDHAREYGLPIKDPEAAADIISDGWAETVDLGRIRSHRGVDTWFGTVAATGFDSLASDRANRMSWPHGRMRYNLAIVVELSKLRPLPFRLVLDGSREIEANLTLAAFGNTRSYGGGMLICPHADSTDGQLDLTLVHATSRTRLIRLLPHVFRGTHVALNEVSTTRAASIQVDSPGITAYADGEYACALPAEISAVAGALQILRQP